MSDLFTESGWERRVADARIQQLYAGEEEPGFLDNALSAAGHGIMRGGARVGEFMGILGSAPFVLAEKSLGTEGMLTDSYFRGVDDLTTDALEFWTPDAKTTGALGRVLGGLGEMALPLMATGGNPALLVGTQEIGTAADLTREGVDARTAVTVGVTQGVAAALGVKTPILGKMLGQRVFTGAIGNTAVNMGATFAEQKILEGRGYEELAKQYDPLDAEGRIVDLLMGAAFGAIHHVGVRGGERELERISQEARAAIMAAANARHFQVDTAPGRPLDAAASAAHQRAMESSLESLITGEKVNVAPEAVATNLEERPRSAPIDEAVVRDVIGEIPRPEEPSVKSQAEDAAEGYSVAEGELTDEQLAAFQGLRSDVQADQDLGGPGARESGESRNQGDGSPRRGEPLRVYRGARRPLSAEDFNPEALGFSTEHPSSGLGVFFTNTGDHAANYGDVSEHFLDIHNPKVVKVEDFPGLDSLDEYRALAAKLKAEGHDGMIIDASHLGGPVNYVAFDHAQVLPAAKKPAAAKPKAKESKPAEAPTAEEITLGGDEAASPLIESVRETLLTRDVPFASGETDADGNMVVRSGREVLAEAEAGIAKAQADSVGFEAAVSCFLTQGFA